MIALKEQILLGIFEEFENWFSEKVVCQKGCSVCCTQQVVITAVEGELIYRKIREQHREEWFAEKLQKKDKTTRHSLTSNGFASECLQGNEVEPQSYGNGNPCPFLEDSCCSIYEVRPFSCRCFTSTQKCRPGSFAVIRDAYLSASASVMQIIEHLGQGEYLGNMLDVLQSLSDLPENRKYSKLLPASIANRGRENVTKALPLPGFLLLEEEMAIAAPLLEAIFAHQVSESSIEDILNNK